MSDEFAGQRIPCPHCKATDTCRVPLKCSERNYSGCSVDMANCPECGKGFSVSYKIDEVVPVESWDELTRTEREAYTKRERAKELERKRQELAELENAVTDDERERKLP